MEDGRTRKISAKWRQQQQQQQVPVTNQFDDAGWADDAETHVGFNAFDFSASPEAFDGSEQQQGQSKAPAEPSQDNQQVEQEQEARNASLWERRRQQDGLGRQLPTLGQDALWGGPVHYATHDAQRRALYYQPQYYA
ncbi:unnamed protein product [Phytophthora lilii]|uniref:Unnamed protein product n=1 Tax=Phytophthora lilii TaxID=2077276 RepID=A0A9W6WV65_9STRA|nr:unnamed protein product [Phytophthora lilii]